MPRVMRFVRPNLYPKQLAALYHRQSVGCLQASTKSGKSLAARVWLLEQGLRCGRGESVVWAAPSHDLAYEVGFLALLESMSPELVKGEPVRSAPSRIPLVNGASMVFKGGERVDTTLYGREYRAAVIDEASRCKEAVRTAIESTLSYTGGPLRMIGNLVTASWFDEYCQQVAAGAIPDAEYHELTWRDAVAAGVLRKSVIERIRAGMDPATFAELYEVRRRAAGSNPFGLEFLRRARTGESCPDRTHADIAWRSARFGPAVAWGWDLAGAGNPAAATDYTFGVGLDADGAACAIERFQLDAPATMERMVGSTGKLPAQVDSTFNPAVVECLHADGHLNFAGFKITQASRRELLTGLVHGVQSGGLRFPAGALYFELVKFALRRVRTANGHALRPEASPGAHDDGVFALALAREALGRRAAVDWDDMAVVV